MEDHVKDEILQLIKDNLEIRADLRAEYGRSGPVLTVQLFLGHEMIDQDEVVL